MSGHNKWSKIKHVKAKQDAKKGKEFTRCGREIVVAARAGGGDPDMNAGLRTAIDRARAVNMPMANIERAIKKGTGELEGESYDEVMYEGYGPAGAAVYIRTLTDNRNRTVADLRLMFKKAGGSLGDNGSVDYMFERKGVFHFEDLGLGEDEFMEVALEAGCDDIEVNENEYTAICGDKEFASVREAFEKAEYSAIESGLEFLPVTAIDLAQEDMEKVIRFLDTLDEQDDVQNVYCNVNF